MFARGISIRLKPKGIVPGGGVALLRVRDAFFAERERNVPLGGLLEMPTLRLISVSPGTAASGELGTVPKHRVGMEQHDVHEVDPIVWTKFRQSLNGAAG
jgi:hypothetical protein